MKKETLPLGWIDDWMPPTEGLTNRERWYCRTALLAVPFASLLHTGWIPLFAYWGVREMVWFNLVSAPFYAGMWVLVRRGKLALTHVVMSAEINLHAIFAVYFVGWGAGFQYYILMWMPVGPMIVKSTWKKFGLCLLQVLIFLGLYQFTVQGHSPAYEINSLEIQAVNSSNIIVAFGFLTFFVAYYMDVAQRVEEALDRAHEKSEDLLQNVFPDVVAKRLKNRESTVADRFPEASILFGDLVGFTELAQEASPESLVTTLDNLFSQFDELVEKHQVEKIKTIGDEYMIVSGIPEPAPDHADHVARFALDMLEALEKFNQQTGTDLNIRIGIHSGEVVAGVIGNKRFHYDLWGDSVNQASRMESSGLPGKIHITGETRDRLDSSFQVEERGTIEVKGMGNVTTYFLNGRNL